jgi:hypothetical protein
MTDRQQAGQTKADGEKDHTYLDSQILRFFFDERASADVFGNFGQQQ